MLIIRPYIYNYYPDIVYGFSTKIGPSANPPYYFNMSYSVGDKKEIVDSNRELFFTELGLSREKVGYQKQVHGDTIQEVNTYGNCGESDALITTKKNLGLAISSADCPVIFIYNPVKKVIAAVHTGWRGTEKKIVQKTIESLKNDFKSNPSDLIIYLGPSISQINYEVGEEVSKKFDPGFILKKESKFYLDLRTANYRMMLDAGVKKQNIQVSKLCSYEYGTILHSYRRDGQKSGRALGVIAMKDTS